MLRITEVMASNDDTLLDFEGDSPDWVELYNPSDEAVDLAGLHLTDRSNNLTKWEFPPGESIAPGGYRVVFASNKDLVAPGGELHTSFALSAGGEYLGLVAADGVTVIDEFAPEFPPQVEDVSFGLSMAPTGLTTTLVASGAGARAWRPTGSFVDTTWTDPDFDDAFFNLPGPTGFGYEASPGGAIDYTSEILTTVPQGTTSLYLRVPFGLTSFAGLDGLRLRMKYDDGFVAYLNGEPIASSNAADSTQWNSTATTFVEDEDAIVFEEFDVSSAVGSLVIGQNVLAIHALNLSSSSSDFLVVPELVATQSAIVSPTTTGFFDEPTPGYANGESFAGFAAQPEFSVPHGFYASGQQVAITSATPGALIVYTTDGSTPAVNAGLVPTNGAVYSGPVPVNATTTIRATAFKADFRPSFVRASSYVFVDDVITQSPQGQTPPGWAAPGTDGKELNYGIDPEILSRYGDQAVKDSLLAIPSMALTTDLENLFDPATGIYLNAPNRGRDWERAASVELINPDGTEGFSTNAGLRIRGGFSRGDFNPKHAFRLYFRGEYGDGKLNFPLFGDGVDEFDVLDLRTAQNYSWSLEGNTQNTFLREVFARDTQADLGQPHTRSQYYHLYLDGQYWGLYMTQERVEEDFGASHFGGEPEDYDVVKADLAVSGGTEIADGNDLAWRQLFDLAQDLADNPTGLLDNYWTMQGLNPDGTRNETLPVLLDTANLVDYMLIIFYTGGYDSGLSSFLGNERANNWFGIRNRETADRGFQFYLHDNEHSLGAASDTHGSLTIDRTGPFRSGNDRVFAQFNPHFLHQDLLNHPEYRQAFIDRVQEVMFNGGPLTVEANVERLLERKGQVEPAIIAEAARWGDSKVSTPRNTTTWENEVDWLVETYFPQRGGLVRNQLWRDGLFTRFSAPVFAQHGGEVASGYELSIAGDDGTIYVTTDGSTDPRLIGGGINPSAAVSVYTGPITLTADTTVRARLRTASGQWSGLVEASFDVAGLPGDYDTNGIVAEADYEVWRSTFGSMSDLRADGNGDGAINAADYTVWRDRLDATANRRVAQGPATAEPAGATPPANPAYGAPTPTEESDAAQRGTSQPRFSLAARVAALAQLDAIDEQRLGALDPAASPPAASLQSLDNALLLLAQTGPAEESESGLSTSTAAGANDADRYRQVGADAQFGEGVGSFDS